MNTPPSLLPVRSTKPRPFSHWNRLVERSTLHAMYILDGMTVERIAEVLELPVDAVTRQIHEYELERGKPFEALPQVPFVSREMLEYWYLLQKNSCRTIAARYVVSKQTVLRWLRAFDIPVRKTYTSKNQS